MDVPVAFALGQSSAEADVLRWSAIPKQGPHQAES
jgi:hypothetical protein